MVTLVLLFLITLFISFLCSLLESTLLSAQISYLSQKKEEKASWAKSALELKKDSYIAITSIVILNTVANTAGATLIGALAAQKFQNISMGIISTILTLSILIFSEIIPKSIGSLYWKKTIPFAAYITQIIIFITYPLVILVRILGNKINTKTNVTGIDRKEIYALAKKGEEEGVFSPQETHIIKNFISSYYKPIFSVMIPRRICFFVHYKTSCEEMLKYPEFDQFSRIPLYMDRKKHRVFSYVLKTDILKEIVEGRKETPAYKISRRAIVTYEKYPIHHVFNKMLEKKEHMAIVVDEFGIFSGIITLEDIVEILMGLKIVDEKDAHPDLREKLKKKK
jgi:CBS domain containing-hemolysin-like protein